MSERQTPTVYDQIWEVVKRLNRASRGGDLDALRALTHQRIVMVLPGLERRACGQEAYLASVAEFAARGRVLDYQEHDQIIDLFGDTAMVTYRYEAVWEAEGKRFEEHGHDLLVLLRRNDDWVLAWRTLMPAPEASPPCSER